MLTGHAKVNVRKKSVIVNIYFSKNISHAYVVIQIKSESITFKIIRLIIYNMLMI